MPQLAYPFEEWTAEGGLPDDPLVPPGVIRTTGVYLRRVGHDGIRWDPDGTLIAEATFTTPIFRMDALTEVIGVGIDVCDRLTGERVEGLVSLQITLDGGATYQHWDGAAWVVEAVDGAYTDRRDFDEHCGTLIIPDNPSVGFRVKLVAGDADPLVAGFVPYFEWGDYNALLDFFTTIRRAVDEIRYPVTRKTQLSAATDTITPDVRITIDEGRDARVFNLTDDPGRTADLFDAWAAGDITLTGAQGINSVLELVVYGAAKVTIAQRDELVDITEIPHTVVRIGTPREVAESSSGELADYRDGDDQRWLRRRLTGPVRVVPVEINYWAARPRDAIWGAEQVRRALERLRSNLSGARWRIDITRPESLRESVSDGLFSGEFMCNVYTRVFPTDYVQENLVREVVVAHVNRPDEVVEVRR